MQFSPELVALRLYYKIHYGSFIGEVDEFLGVKTGVFVAEEEIENANQTFTQPAWIGEEVSPDSRYFNSNLVALFQYVETLTE